MTERSAPTDDCCVGEPVFGDPRGLHDQDCPVYQRNMDVLERLGGTEVSSILPRHRIELARLDQIQTAIWAQALQGDAKTIDTVRRLMERQAQLLGLDEIQTRFSDQASIAAIGVPGTEVTAGGLLEKIYTLAKQIDESGPWPARFECGDQVPGAFLALLPTTPTTGPPANQVWGIPIRVRDDMDPDAWRIINTNGQVSKEGTVRRP